MNRKLLIIAGIFVAGIVLAGGILLARDSDEELFEPVETEQVSESEQEASDINLQIFSADVWADNWFAMYVNGELVAEDSVPITTERSFNKESFTFEASYPLTIAIEAKDFKENDTGLEYIGTDRQQMGDGGIIAQIMDQQTGETIAATNNTWRVFVVQRGPLNPTCESSANPEQDCQFENINIPSGWTAPNFDDSGWDTASVYSESQVSPKDGYDEVMWYGGAELIWGSDLEIDNTILLRQTVAN